MTESVKELFALFVFNFACTRSSILSLFTIMVRSTTNHRWPRTPSRLFVAIYHLVERARAVHLHPITTWVISHQKTALLTILVLHPSAPQLAPLLQCQVAESGVAGVSRSLGRSLALRQPFVRTAHCPYHLVHQIIRRATRDNLLEVSSGVPIELVSSRTPRSYFTARIWDLALL